LDFFHHQDQARRNTLLLVSLLVAAVISLIAITTIFTALFIHYFQLGTGIHLQAAESGQSVWSVWWQALSGKLIFSISAVVIISVVMASQFKAVQLRRGGEAVAAALDGQLLNRDLATLPQSQLLNVVEEMAIAAGTPVPPVYLIQESAINAFAAGYRPTDAVIGITQGALDTLNREQLQGVVAHEFSHILNGDMRLNMRLISLLSGIMFIGTVGRVLLRSFNSSRRSGDSKDKRGGVMAFGLGLVVIGFAGTFFGKLIASATSRQREFLADASAVQFTRNPNGIAGALNAIRHHAAGSQLQHKNAVEFSHLYFGESVTGFLSNWFATHPPLEERIKRIDPKQLEATRPEPDKTQSKVFTDLEGRDALVRFQAMVTAGITPGGITLAQQQLASVPTSLSMDTRNIFSARALIYGILLSPMSQTEQTVAKDYLSGKSHPAVFKRLQAELNSTMELPRAEQWVLLLQTLATLRQLSAIQKSIFIRNTKYLIEHDQKVTLFEWCIFELVKQSCGPVGDLIVREFQPRDLNNEISCLLTFVAFSNWVDVANTSNLMATINAEFDQVKLLDKNAVSFRLLSQSVRRLRYLPPLLKPKLLKTVLLIMHDDGKISENEEILLKTLSLCLDCPLPERP